jgi:hypothetical protein
MLCKDIFVDFDGDISPLSILLDLYRSEHDSPQKRDEWETYYKMHHPESYEKFLNYKEKIEKRTPNIKQMYFDFLDGKRDHPEFKYFSLEGL